MYASSSSSSSSQPPPISPDEWATHLLEVAVSHKDAGISGEGRKYLYINSADQIAAFVSYKEAKRAGYKEKLSFDRLISFTRELMSCCGDENVKLSAATNLRRLAIYKAVRDEDKGRLQKLFGKNLLSIDHVLTIGTDISPLLSSMIHPAYLQAFVEFVQESIKLIRSESGDRGAYFFISEFGERKGLKMEMDPIKHLVADRFFKKMGFETPNYSVVSKESPEGLIILEKLKELSIPCYEELISSPLYQTRKGTFLHQIKHRKFFVLMDYINYKPFRKVNIDDFLRDLHDPAFLKNLGEIMFLDCIIHNTDRLTPLACNLGNIMRKTDRYLTEGEKKIVSLDHDYNLTLDKLPNCKDDLTDLFFGDRIEKNVRSLISSMQVEITDDQIRQIILPNLKIGVNEAAQRFIEDFSDPTSVIEILDVPMIEHVSRPNHLIFINLRKFTEELIK